MENKKVPLKETRRVQEIGKSFFINIPVIWCKANKIEKLETLEIELYPDHIVIRKFEDAEHI